ncbi:alpha/beta fold hydrolase [Parathalassolituus penaei]|uniref:Alpha/beta hydrolase n=1 Tax=Parathalassolituus penaei TaxID=2997323 RepID=A0A9X3IUX2_9GAMM|nr:alpha/beta hydrolase [Parathalassolituus penaei]MCY0967374.1 alpha/beta hydrolase [Parathalassolituus penaei]
MTPVQPTRIDYLYQSPEGPLTGSYLLWEPEGPARKLVLCVHGLTRNAHDFDYLARALVADGYRVVSADVVGRGDSQWLEHPEHYGYPLYIGQMQQLLQQLLLKYQVTTLDWVGTSMGGLIGMMIAAHPASPIEHLVMNDVGWFIPKEALQRLASYVGKDSGFADEAAVERYLRVVAAPFGPLTDEQWQHLAHHSAEPDPVHPGTLRLRYDPTIANAFANVPILTDVDLSPVWTAVTTRVLLIRGGVSDLLLPETARQMAAQSNVQLAEFPGIGHAPALMARDQILAIKGFLTS